MPTQRIDEQLKIDTIGKSCVAEIMNGTADKSDIMLSLLKLSDMLYQHYGEGTVIIVDEYDAQIHCGHTNNFYAEEFSFMRNLLSERFMDNGHLAFGFLTGILRVAKESIFSGLNNLTINYRS